MKNPISGKAMFLALGAAALLWVAPAGAQTSTMRAEIPFAFVAGADTLPAGQYLVTVDPDFRRCRLDSLTNSATWLISLSPTSDSRTVSAHGKGTLRFTRYGEQSFLTNIWRPGKEDGNRVVVSKRLLEAARSKVGDDSPVLISVAPQN